MPDRNGTTGKPGKTFVIVGCVAAALSVIFGAFGAHALRGALTPADMVTFETAVRYQMYHALALILTGILRHDLQAKEIAWAGFAFVAGILLFSFSLYLVVLTDTRSLGAIAPLGGIAFVIGWLAIAVAYWRESRLD